MNNFKIQYILQEQIAVPRSVNTVKITKMVNEMKKRLLLLNHRRT